MGRWLNKIAEPPESAVPKVPKALKQAKQTPFVTFGTPASGELSEIKTVLSRLQIARINQYFDLVGECVPETRADFLEQCRVNPEVRNLLLSELENKLRQLAAHQTNNVIPLNVSNQCRTCNSFKTELGAKRGRCMRGVIDMGEHCMKWVSR